MSDQQTKQPGIFAQTFKEITQPFIDLFRAPRVLWGINVSYLLEGLTYFGVIGLLAIFFNEHVGLDDIQAGRMVGFLTAGITLSMLFLGATVDIIGVRKSLLLSLGLMLVGRVLMTIAPAVFQTTGMWSSSHMMVMFGIIWVVLGYGIYQPACYAAVKKFTDEKTAAMGYAMLYGIMNLGAFLPGLISPPVRRAFGITGVFWVYIVLTVVGILSVAIILSKKAIAKAERDLPKTIKNNTDSIDNMPVKEKMAYYLKNFPLKDMRFLYFVFILIPVQTLFAHNWLTMPQYTSRAFTGFIQDNFEFFVNFNPILIFIALPTFILVLGPSVYTLFAYLIITTIGEAMWQPRFLQWVAEIAPKGMTGIYMGIGQFPWFLTKVITSLYSGWFLMQYCPDNTPAAQLKTETMWFWYGVIAIISPLGLLLTKNWMQKGFKDKAAV
ncbi:MAG: MFS transporter [Ignavibacteriales bacterium]|nr:MFS transporter [Ignavibacteriales bacterium]